MVSFLIFGVVIFLKQENQRLITIEKEKNNSEIKVVRIYENWKSDSENKKKILEISLSSSILNLATCPKTNQILLATFSTLYLYSIGTEAVEIFEMDIPEDLSFLCIYENYIGFSTKTEAKFLSLKIEHKMKKDKKENGIDLIAINENENVNEELENLGKISKELDPYNSKKSYLPKDEKKKEKKIVKTEIEEDEYFTECNFDSEMNSLMEMHLPSINPPFLFSNPFEFFGPKADVETSIRINKENGFHLHSSTLLLHKKISEYSGEIHTLLIIPEYSLHLDIEKKENFSTFPELESISCLIAANHEAFHYNLKNPSLIVKFEFTTETLKCYHSNSFIFALTSTKGMNGMDVYTLRRSNPFPLLPSTLPSFLFDHHFLSPQLTAKPAPSPSNTQSDSSPSLSEFTMINEEEKNNNNSENDSNHDFPITTIFSSLPFPGLQQVLVCGDSIVLLSKITEQIVSKNTPVKKNVRSFFSKSTPPPPENVKKEYSTSWSVYVLNPTSVAQFWQQIVGTAIPHKQNNSEVYFQLIAESYFFLLSKIASLSHSFYLQHLSFLSKQNSSFSDHSVFLPSHHSSLVPPPSPLLFNESFKKRKTKKESLQEKEEKGGGERSKKEEIIEESSKALSLSSLLKIGEEGGEEKEKIDHASFFSSQIEFENCVKLFKTNSNMLGDYFLTVKDYQKCAIFYSMSERKLSDVVSFLIPEKESAKALVTYLNKVIFDESKIELVEDNYKLSNSLIDHYFRYSPHLLSSVILYSSLTCYSPHLVIELLSQFCKSPQKTQLDLFVRALLLLDNGDLKLSLSSFQQISPHILVLFLVNNQHLLEEDLHSHYLSRSSSLHALPSSSHDEEEDEEDGELVDDHQASSSSQNFPSEKENLEISNNLPNQKDPKGLIEGELNEMLEDKIPSLGEALLVSSPWTFLEILIQISQKKEMHFLNFFGLLSKLSPSQTKKLEDDTLFEKKIDSFQLLLTTIFLENSLHENIFPQHSSLIKKLLLQSYSHFVLFHSLSSKQSSSNNPRPNEKKSQEEKRGGEEKRSEEEKCFSFSENQILIKKMENLKIKFLENAKVKENDENFYFLKWMRFHFSCFQKRPEWLNHLPPFQQIEKRDDLLNENLSFSLEKSESKSPSPFSFVSSPNSFSDIKLGVLERKEGELKGMEIVASQFHFHIKLQSLIFSVSQNEMLVKDFCLILQHFDLLPLNFLNETFLSLPFFSESKTQNSSENLKGYCNYSFTDSLKFLILPSYDLVEKSIQQVIYYYPSIILLYSQIYCKNDLNEWKKVLDLFCKLIEDPSLHLFVKNESQKMKEYYISIYKSILENLSSSEFVDPSQFLDILPTKGSISFYLPYLEKIVRIHNTSQLSK